MYYHAFVFVISIPKQMLRHILFTVTQFSDKRLDNIQLQCTLFRSCFQTGFLYLHVYNKEDIMFCNNSPKLN